MLRQLILLLIIVVAAGLLVARAPDAGATPIPAPPVSQVLSPVAGPLEVVTKLADCSGNKWCFNQHKIGGHAPGGGIGGADDTLAWDANLNTPAHDSDKGKPVFAVASGVVAQSFGGRINADRPTTGGFGQILVEHTSHSDAKWWSGYLHLRNIRVSPGQPVTERDVLGFISNVGVDDENNHLHFVIYTGTNTLGGLRSFIAPIAERGVGIISTVAGGFIGDGSPATRAQLVQPMSVAVDGAGNLFIADTGNGRIRRLDAATGVITTVAGTGGFGFSGDGGLATSASLNVPRGVAVDAAGNLFIADELNSRVRRVDAATRIITTVAGSATSVSSGDGGPATSASLSLPGGVALDAAGNLFIADRDNHRIRLVDARTGVITTVAGTDTGGSYGDGGPATSATLDFPTGVAVDAAGNLFIADERTHLIRRVDAVTRIITTVAGTGARGFSGDGGPATSATLVDPNSVAMDTAGNLFIADSDNPRIRRVDARTGVITTVAGTGTEDFSGDGGPATSANLDYPTGVAVDAAGNLFIADAGNDRVRRVAAATRIITTVAGSGNQGFSGDNGPATSASLSLPGGVAVDAAGNLFIADTGNGRIRKVVGVAASGPIVTGIGQGAGAAATITGPAGVITTVAQGLSLQDPRGVAVDAAGNLFIADTLNNRIRRVDGATRVITTVAGTGTRGFSGDGGPAASASLNLPLSVAVDGAGNLFIADTSNHRIRRVAAATGFITAVAGKGSDGFSGDGGPATSASLNFPQGVGVDAAGNLFFADTGNGRIRRLDAATGVITTVAGIGNRGFSGDGGPATSARLARPFGVAVDAAGNLFIADTVNNRVRKVDASTGVITTVAGVGSTWGFSGDGGPATSAQIDEPWGVTVDTAGNLFIADAANNRVRKVSGVVTASTRVQP